MLIISDLEKICSWSML